MNKIFIIIIIIVSIILICAGLWLYYRPAGQQNTMNNLNQNNTLRLEFFAGGSITGNSFKVNISDGQITYQEFEPGKTDPINKIDRSLSQSEFEDIVKTITNSNIIKLQSQDFAKEPMIPDQGRYDISLTLGGQNNKVVCSIAPPAGTEPKTKNCQKQIDNLRDKLNTILGVSIY